LKYIYFILQIHVHTITPGIALLVYKIDILKVC